MRRPGAATATPSARRPPRSTSTRASSAARAADLRDQLGHAAAKQIIIDRGRWDKNGDIDDIYARASLEEHGAASVGLSSADHGPSLEEAHPGWVQPAQWRRS